MKEHNKTNRTLIIVIIALSVVIIGMIIAGIVIVRNNKSVADNEGNTKEIESARDSDEDDNSKPEADDLLTTKVTSDSDKTTDSDESSKPDKVTTNPLAGQEVEYPGTKKEKDSETADLLRFFIDNEKSINKEEILVATVDDFDVDGDYEAFIFVGECISNEYEEYYNGCMWFTNGKTVNMIGESGTGSWWNVNGFLDFEGRKYAYATVYYATGGMSCVWSVYGDDAATSEINCLGSVYLDDNGDLCITNDIYDGTLDSDTGWLIGHTWKPYYFYFDKEKKQLVEYGGAFVRKDQIDDISGIDLVEQIQAYAPDSEITTAFYRENGLLTVNYRTVSPKGDVTYSNANYNVKDGKFLNAWSDGPGDVSTSDYGGIYVSTLSSLPATYPTVDQKTEDIELYITSFNNVAQSYDSVLMSGRINDMSGSWQNYLVDRNTVLELPEDGENVSAVDWLYKKIMQERENDYTEVEGVYHMTVTNGHVDSISGLYWWD